MKLLRIMVDQGDGTYVGAEAVVQTDMVGTEAVDVFVTRGEFEEISTAVHAITNALRDTERKAS